MIVKLVHTFVGLLLLATSCGSREIEGTDGNTHWLPCENDSDCTNLTCRDGFCRAPTEGEQDEVESRDDSPGGPTDAIVQVERNAPGTKPTYASSVSGALGAACIPLEEYSLGFSGFEYQSVYLAPSEQCDSNLCLVNHFQGRVTCPLGQSGGADGPCFTADGAEPVVVDVAPQLVDRSPQEAVYCSCRCDGPDPDADYCACGEGFACTEVTSLGIPGGEELVGSYCVVSGTDVPYENIGSRKCSLLDDPVACADATQYSPEALEVDPVGYASNDPATEIWFEFLDLSDQQLCLPRSLPIQPERLAAGCRVFEAVPYEGDIEYCSRTARTNVSFEDAAEVRAKLAAGKLCTADCGEWSICELQQLTAGSPDAAASCLNDENPTGDGWCYIEPIAGMGNDERTSQCPEQAQRRVRAIGAAADVGNSFTLLYCMGPV